MEPPEPSGAQRLPISHLKEWEQQAFGMFLTYGMSTFDGDEFSPGEAPSGHYHPTHLDVDQWIGLARDTGMRYAVLTAKHVSGHCLWPSSQTEYHVGNSGDRTDVVGAFVNACRERGVRPGLYYCLWDNHHRFGSVTPTDVLRWQRSGNPNIPATGDPFEVLGQAFTTPEANDFFLRQVNELLTGYGDLFEVWIDIPGVAGRPFREQLYKEISRRQPGACIMMNNGFGNGSRYPVDYAWPADLMSMERAVPDSRHPFNPWREIEGKSYYLPGECCDTMGREWFGWDHDQPRSDAELLGMYLTTRARGANLLLNAAPDQTGRIPERFAQSLLRLRANLDRLDLPES